MEEEINRYKEMKKSAFILGFTGECGKALVNELVNSKLFEKVILIGRREVKYPYEEKYNILEQHVVDYDNISTHQADFSGCDVGFCCLGTTKGKSGKDGFYKVDHDYVVNSAKTAKDAGCKHFHLVSSQGADGKSSFLYMKTKGEVEEELKSMGFERLSIYRPAILMCDREESRPGERLVRFLLKPVQWFSPSAYTTPTTTLAKCLANNCVIESKKNIEMLENRAIFKVAGDIKEKGKMDSSKANQAA